MPELPDVEMYRKKAEKCKSSVIEKIIVVESRFVKVAGNELNERLNGKQFKQIMRHGKYLFLITEEGTSVVLHFGMTGSLDCSKKDGDTPKYTMCSVEFNNKYMLHVLSRRKLGFIELAENLEAYISAKNLGPDALAISKDEFLSRLGNSKSMIKTVVTDQSVISGIGNVYADEILFQAGIHPGRKTLTLTKNEKLLLFTKMQKVLKTAIRKNADVTQFPPGYLLPVRSKNENCPGCTGKLEVMKISGRTTFFCPSCQKSSY